MLQHKYKDMRVNMEDKELVKMFNPTLKKQTLLRRRDKTSIA